jgi:uncharacterized protein YebE (UPF0316 family)
MELETLWGLLPGALLIFSLRVADMTLDTLRVLIVLRGQRAAAWVLGFFQALVFVLAITSVLRDLGNLLNIFGYAAGFATGNVLGMWIESRLAVGFTHIRIISSRSGSAIADMLRGEGYAVTEISGRGRDGTVALLNCSVQRKHTRHVGALVRAVDEDAFITTEDVRPLMRGFWRA